jgi:hypothetical protein
MKRATEPSAWERPDPPRTGPIRGIGGFYRSADREVDGKLFRGVPLNTAEDAALAAVRMAYRIADTQIDRGLRVARDLRGAARREGIEPRDAVDASERLISKALLAGLQWFESAAGEEGHPLRRIAAAEYRMIGSLLGIAPAAAERAPAADASAGTAHPESVASATRQVPDSLDTDVDVFNTAKKETRRPVLSARLMTGRGIQSGADDDLRFHHADADAAPILGKIRWGGKTAPRLKIEANLEQQRGFWVAGVYKPDGQQIGIVSIEL